MDVVKLLAVELVEDFDLYPRIRVDDVYVARLAEAIRAGAVLPPIVADRASRTIVDGLHRRLAALHVFGEMAVVDVELRDYPSKREMFLDALRLNAAHGKRLTKADEVRAAILAERVGIPKDEVAAVLKIRFDRFEKVVVERVGTAPSGGPVILKPAVRHLAGQIVTPAQEEANRHLNGNQASYYARMLILLLSAGAIDWSDTKLVERLYQLRDLLNQALEERAA